MAELVEHAAEGVASFDAQGRHVWFNRAWCETLGYPEKDLLGTPWEIAVHPEDRETTRAVFDQAVRRVPIELALRLVRRDGMTLPARWVLSPGEDGGQYCLLRGVGEEARIESRLANQSRVLVELARRRTLHEVDVEGAYREVLESAARALEVERVGLWFYDEQHAAIRCVDLFERTPARHAPGGTVNAVDYPDYFRALAEARTIAAHDARTDPRTSEFAVSYLEPLGITSMMDAPIRLHGRIIGVVCHEHVGTPRRWAAEEQTFAASIADMISLTLEANELASAERALRRSEAQLRQAQKLEALGRLAGGVAHDFNNILTVILGYSRALLARIPEADPLHGTANEIHRAGERAAQLTRQLLAFSRRQVLQPTRLDVGAVVTDMAPMLLRLLGEDITLQIENADVVPAVRADRGQIEQVVLNLAINARDAMPRGGTLTIETRVREVSPESAPPSVRPGPYVMLVVRDTGDGMDDETRAHIFEPFFTTKDVGKGTGLGLATVDGVVRQSEGFIEVDSAPGAGSEFRIGLPAAPRAPADAASTPSAPAATMVPRGTGQTVLLAEDEPTIRDLARSMLVDGGYNVLTAADAAEALRVAASHQGPIHLLLTDVLMPGLNGRELARQLGIRRPGLRVLYMSGWAEGVADVNGIGGTLLEKPFTPVTLLERVHASLAGV